ncbi:conserved hypothetical protein [Helicobacter cinaedi CCUG 18818 = ATCC BAA-847]|uniref:Outer membrane protein n=1 Tax=Helicobacter cinaedi CCUG 18818 = ATCC BAA-847 TaxID=537971 RepID=A0AAI8QF96_9HELI|nr:hypothetical protein [Helicobacter cinaedi]BAM31376.1 conserved hypothetical protein [Helicobacter cinaedi CCUG 18818 = ATCC BAA-847]
MKKIVLWILGIILALFVLIFCVLFTPPGNALLKPIIQGQIDKYAPIKLELETFSLGISSVELKIAHNDTIIITLGGDFSLFSQTLDLALKVDARDIAVLGELVDTPLQGSFVINTTAKGSLKHLEVNTTSDIAKSFTDIRVTLQDFTPTAILANIKDAQIKEFLAMAGIKPYASGSLSLEADIKGDQNMNFNGNTLLQIAQGLVDSTLIKKDFDVDVPKTTFVTTLNALFDMDKLNHDFSFNGNIGNIHSSGQTLLKTLSTNTSYAVDLSDLSAFTPLVGMPIRGSFNTKGEVKGGIESLEIKGSSNIASSNTSYEALLKNLAPDTIKAQVSNLKLDTLLWMIYMPRYADMRLNLNAVVSELDKGISTKTDLTLTGTTNNVVMKKEFDLDMPNTKFNLTSGVVLKQGIGEANSKLDSDIANLNLAKTQINLKDSSFVVPYVATIPNLKKLKFLTGMELAGDFKAQGTAKLKDTLYADFSTQSLGGSIDAKLDNNKLFASLKDVNTLKLFSIAQLKPVFSSSMNGDFNYDTLTEKGTLKAVLSNGKLMPNEITQLAEKYLKTDITKEAYEDAGLNATIDKKLITTDIGLTSNNTAIYAQEASIDTEKGKINADIKFQIKDKYIYLKARDNLASPSLSIDASDLIKAEASKALSKGAEQAIDKYIKDDKIKEGAGKLLNNLFK